MHCYDAALSQPQFVPLHYPNRGEQSPAWRHIAACSPQPRLPSLRGSVAGLRRSKRCCVPTQYDRPSALYPRAATSEVAWPARATAST